MKVNQSGFLISKIHSTSARIFERQLKKHGLDEINPAQGRILFVLWQEGELPFHELAGKAGLGKSTLTSMLKRMEAAGLVRREPLADKRMVLVSRTEKAKRLEQAYSSVSAEMNGAVYQGLSAAEQAELERLLELVLENCMRIETESQAD